MSVDSQLPSRRAHPHAVALDDAADPGDPATEPGQAARSSRQPRGGTVKHSS